MKAKEFEVILGMDPPPPNLTEWQRALWHIHRKEWEHAHRIVQSNEGASRFDHIHAYLHRLEGDEGNAAYWYSRAGVQPQATAELEYEAIIRTAFYE